jgi:hypothetical protein
MKKALRQYRQGDILLVAQSPGIVIGTRAAPPPGAHDATRPKCSTVRLRDGLGFVATEVTRQLMAGFRV